MAKIFDMSRPVPWKRLMRELVICVAIATVVMLIIYRNRLDAGLFAGLLISGPMYLTFGALLAKMGYQRKTYSELRSARTDRQTRPAAAATAGSGPARAKPAPTRRTAGSSSRPSTKARPKRR